MNMSVDEDGTLYASELLHFALAYHSRRYWFQLG